MKLFRWRKKIEKKDKDKIHLWDKGFYDGYNYKIKNKDSINFDNHPWNSEIIDYLNESIFPKLESEIDEISEGKYDIELKWIWEEPWEIHCVAEAKIKMSNLRYDNPTEFTGGVGYLFLKVNGNIVDPDVFTLIVCWDNVRNYFRINFNTTELFKILAYLDMKISLRNDETPDVSFDIPYKIQEKEETEEIIKEELVKEAEVKAEDKKRIRLVSDMKSAFKSLGYKKNEIDWPDVELIIDKFVNDGSYSVEDCLNEFLKTRR